MLARRIVLLAVVLVNLLLLVLWRTRGADPKPASAPPNEFSVARSHAVLSDLLREGVPHPSGTAANAVVRDRVMTRFRELGYEVKLQKKFVCSPFATCATVENIIAEAPVAAEGGGAPRDALLVAVHYDSVAAGPGASDDGTGVATLIEIARAIRNERFRNRVIFLVDDAEEIALLGAEAFVAEPALADPVVAVINLENRGGSGPSYMFETSRHNRWLIRHFARSATFPAATSLFYTIYDRMPNDTDVTVFKRAGKAAVNFAAIGGIHRYHTPLDNVANVDSRTFQHHGDNVLAMTRALANADLAAQTRDNAVYFDLLGFFLVLWPEGWTVWIGIVSLILLAFGVRKIEPRQMTFGVLAFFTTVIVALVAGIALSWLARLRTDGATWTAMPQTSVAAMWAVGIGAALLAATLFLRRSSERALLAGAAIVWHAIAILVAATLPGASYLFLVPAMAMTILFLARASDVTIAVVSSAGAALFLFPIGVVLYEALGKPSLVITALVIGIFATTFAGVIASRRAAPISFAAALLLALIAMAMPAYTPEKPQQLSIAYVDDDERGALWSVPALTPSLQKAAAFKDAGTLPDWWARRGRHLAEAPKLATPRVEAESQRDGNTIRIRLRSPRNAWRVGLIYKAANVTAIRINGVVPPPLAERDRGRKPPEWRSATVIGNEALIELTVGDGSPIEAGAFDASFGLPAEGAALVAARGNAAVPVGLGDMTITQRRLKL
jgi:hypothetical protein